MNKPTFFSRSAIVTTALVLAPALANAHPGHDATTFSSGIAHPLNGFDHLLAMVAVGIWAVQQGGRALWAIPGAFVGSMVLGGALGMSGMPVPFIEQGILASIFVLGVLIAAAARFSVAQSAALVGLFALFHGFAHGAEAPASGSGFAYVGGFALATALLHLCGIGGGLAIRELAQSAWIRVAGVAVIAAGAFVALS